MREKNYFVHLKFAWTVSLYMLFSAFFLFIHGLIPCLFLPESFTVNNITRKMKKWDAYLKIKKVSRKIK